MLVRFVWCGITGASWPWVRSKAIDFARSTQVARDPRCFMALGVIEGNRSCLFDSGSTRCQALHGLDINLRQSNSSVFLSL